MGEVTIPGRWSVGAACSAVGVVLLMALFLAHAAMFGDYVADDAGISLAYARNIAAGYGPVLFPGAPAVEGYSNPLWTFMLAAAVVLRLDGADGIPLLKLLGLLLAMLTLWLTYLAGRTAYAQDRRHWIAPALLAASTPFVFWGGAGLENALYGCLLLLAATLQWREFESRGAPTLSALALAGVALTRPEGCAFFVAFLIHRLVAGPAALRTPARLLRWAATFAIPFGAFLLVRFAVFGDWLPNTYYAKVTDRELGRLLDYFILPKDPGLEYLAGFASATWPMLLLAAIGLADPKRWRVNLLVLGLAGGTALYVVFVGGDFWPEWRFFTAVLPVIALAAQHGINMMTTRRTLVGSFAAAVLVGIVLHQSLPRSFELRMRHQWDTLISLQGRLEQARRIRAIAESLGVPDPLYMDADIGGPSVAGLRVLDLGGLSDIHIARFQYYAPFFRDYVFREQRPHFIRTHASWTRTSRVTEYPEFEEQYTPIREWRDARGRHGEFVRKDLLDAGSLQRPTAALSFTSAIAHARARRQHELERERSRWIEYYGDRKLHRKLRKAFHGHERAGTLPADRALLADLSFGLLAAGDVESAARVRGSSGLPPIDPVELRHDSRPVLTLLAHRTLRREADRTTRLQLFFSVVQRPPMAFAMWLHLFPQPARGDRLTLDQELGPASTRWRSGEVVMVEKPLYVDPGEYEIRAGLWEPAAGLPLCRDDEQRTCYVLLGHHRVER